MVRARMRDDEAGAGRIVVALGLLAGLGVAGLVGVGWYFADQLTTPPEVRPLEADNQVLAVDGSTVTLRDEGDAGLPGRWGLRLNGGRHAVLGALLEQADGRVTWEVLDAPDPALEVGEAVRVDEYVWEGTPAAVGLPFEDVAVAARSGPLPAWRVPADGEPRGTVVFVHGRGATREEALRFLPTLSAAGWDTLVISYVGDDGAPGWPDERIRFGTTEWEDVEAAVRHVITQDERQRVVLFGVSMGGSMVAQLRDRSELGDEIAGIVLDSPLLSMDALLDVQADRESIPELVQPLLLPVVEAIADTFHGLDSATLEQAVDDATWDLPVLLFHGAADDYVPPLPSFELANAARTIELVNVPTADHVRTWNVDQQGYEETLRRFLDGL